jgi:RNA polymerase sigma-70 factor (ECF subfamily)
MPSTPDAQAAQEGQEASLLARLRAGDESAFDVVFRTYYGSLVGFAESLLHSREAAEDLAQDVMLELWRRREQLVLTDSLRSYLLRAVRNRAFNELRRVKTAKRKEPLVRDDEATPALGALRLEDEELDAAIAGAVDALPAPLRETFVMSRREGLKYQEIATRLGVSVKTVEARMGKALKELRDRLAAWLPGGEGSG